MGRWVTTIFLAVAASLAVTLVSAAPAQAHAALEATSPVDGERLAEAPDQVRLEFDEPVTLPAGGLRIYDAEGERITSADAGTGASAEVVRTVLGEALAPGTYIVTWRVVSADGHPARGAFVFHTGTTRSLDDAALADRLADLFAGDAEQAYAIAAAVARWLMYAGVLLAAGAAAFLVWVVRPGSPGRGALARIAAVATVVGGVAALTGLPLQAAQVTGVGLEAFVRGDLLLDVLSRSVGLQTTVQVLGLAGLFIALRRPQAAWFPAVALTGATLSLAALLIAGHTRTVAPSWLLVTADAAHLAAAATWFAGLVLLPVVLRRRRREDDPVGAADLVVRFSWLATLSLAAVTVTGMAMSWVLVRATRALVTTSYGWTLLAKIAIAAAVIATGAYNHRRLVPAMRRHAEHAWGLLLRTLRAEAVGLVAVLAVTAVLVQLQPASEAAGITGAYVTYVDLGEEYQANLTVDPNRAGFNEIHLYLLDGTGRPAPAEALELLLSIPAEDIGPLRRVPVVAGPGHWILSGQDLVIPGAWQIEIVVAVTPFEELRETVSVVVNP